MLLQLLPLLILIPAAIIMLADNAFWTAIVVTASIGIIAAVSAFAGGQLAALGGVIAIGGGYLTDWPVVMMGFAAFYWLAVLLSLCREVEGKSGSRTGELRRRLLSRGASPSAVVRILALYPWLVSCVAFKRYSIDSCFSPSDLRPKCGLSFLEFALWVCPLLCLFWELITLDPDE